MTLTSSLSAGIVQWGRVPERQGLMLALLAAAVMLVQVRQPYPLEAPLQHGPTILLLLFTPAILRRWPLSDPSVGCVIAFLLLHSFAARWIYSNVPYEAWLHGALTGHASGRNNFDRFVHFAFGALSVVPVTEFMRRHGGTPPRIALFVAFLWVLGVGALYEIFEWGLTLFMAGPIAKAYNGQQGDFWDAQKDMGIAALGALLTIALLWLMRRRIAWRRR